MALGMVWKALVSATESRNNLGFLLGRGSRHPEDHVFFAVLDPHSFKCLLFSLFRFCICLYDVIVTFYELVFNVPSSVWQTVWSGFAVLYWTTDRLRPFILGFFKTAYSRLM
jgi:hypothetical protein